MQVWSLWMEVKEDSLLKSIAETCNWLCEKLMWIMEEAFSHQMTCFGIEGWYCQLKG